MKILMLLENPFPPDIRVQKEADALQNAGHDLILLCPARKDEAVRDTFKTIQIIRFNEIYASNFIKRKLLLLFQALTFRNMKWVRAIEKVVCENSIDALHVHDLSLIEAAAVTKKKLGIPIVADLHENYPELLRIRFNPSSLSWKDKLLVGADRWARREPKMLKNADHVIVVVEEAKDRLFSLGISPEKISVVSNTEADRFWESYPIDESITNKYQNNFVISYIGGFGPHRGLDTAIKAMRIVIKKNLNIKLLLVGAEGWYSDWLQKIAIKEKVSECIDFVPWIPIQKVKSYIKVSNLGIIAHRSTPHTESTVPHKLFQYMLFEKPVVVSSCAPLKRIVEDTKSGLVFEQRNVDEFAQKIIALYQSPRLCKEFGKRARAAATTGKYSWDYQAKKLVHIYKDLAA